MKEGDGISRLRKNTRVSTLLHHLVLCYTSPFLENYKPIEISILFPSIPRCLNTGDVILGTKLDRIKKGPLRMIGRESTTKFLYLSPQSSLQLRFIATNSSSHPDSSIPQNKRITKKSEMRIACTERKETHASAAWTLASVLIVLSCEMRVVRFKPLRMEAA